jgi:hypothetical protein
MQILPHKVRRQLPPIRKIHNPAEDEYCMIYAKLFTPTSGVTFYVAEGEQQNQDFVVWGLVIAPLFKFPLRFEITLGRLQTRDWLGQEPCQLDRDFQPARWGDVERSIPNLRRPLKQPQSSYARVNTAGWQADHARERSGEVIGSGAASRR